MLKNDDLDDEMKRRKDWLENEAIFTKESLIIRGHQVMMRWEKPLMKAMAEVLIRNGGTTLELGMGMGISAGLLLEATSIHKHFVIEAHPGVIENAFNLFKPHINNGKLRILQGFWQEIVPYLKDKSFDGIFFDAGSVVDNPGDFYWKCFYAEAFRLLKWGGVFTFWSDEAFELSKEQIFILKNIGFSNASTQMVDADPSSDCVYWEEKSYIVPIVKK